MSNTPIQWSRDMELAKTRGMVALTCMNDTTKTPFVVSGQWCTITDAWVDRVGDYLNVTPYAWAYLPDPCPPSPQTISEHTTFGKATLDEFEAFFEKAGWEVDGKFAKKPTRSNVTVEIAWVFNTGYINLIDPCGEKVQFENFGANTFGKALRLADNLAQADLMEGWTDE